MFTLILFILFSSAQAAVQGNPSASSSSGDATINLALADAVRISQIEELDFGEYDGLGNLNNNQDLCVYSSTGNYQITLTGSGSSGDFTVSNSNADVIPYRVRWDDDAGQAGGGNMDPGVARTGQTGADTSSTECTNTGLNANIRITFLRANIETAPAGNYTGYITLSVAVE